MRALHPPLRVLSCEHVCFSGEAPTGHNRLLLFSVPKSSSWVLKAWQLWQHINRLAAPCKPPPEHCRCRRM